MPLRCFVGPLPETASATAKSKLEWAAVVRTASPLDLATATAQWSHSVIPKKRKAIAPIPAWVGGKQCFRLPAGTFFGKSRVFGKASFIDRNGKPKEGGIRVGRQYDTRGYVEGGTQSAVTYRFDELETSLLAPRKSQNRG